jgi:hypothetical protein
MSRIDHLTAYHLAIDLVKRAGFQLFQAASVSESCYYFHPGRGRDRLLRLSAHKSKKAPIGLSNICARATFTPKDPYHTEINVYNKVAFAIGRYFLEEPPPSRYAGKRGTWEDQNRSECHGPSPLTVGTEAAAVTHKDHLGNLAPDTPQAAGAGCDQ